MVDDLGNGCEATGVLSLHEQYNTADLDEAPGGGLDINVGHPGNLSEVSYTARHTFHGRQYLYVLGQLFVVEDVLLNLTLTL